MRPVILHAFAQDGPQGRGLQDQIFPRGLAGYDFGEPVGAALAAGETAGEVCAGVVPGDDCAPAGAGEVCGAAWFFISSRRKALLAVLWCAYSTDSANVSAKNIPASHVVNFTSTFVVCAPKMFSVTPEPNAAPRPSLFGRCIRMTSTISAATSTKSTRQKLISRFIGRRNMNAKSRMSNDEWLRQLIVTS